MAGRQPGAVVGLLAGAGLALAGVALVELLIATGARPFSPLGPPGLGLVAAAALFGGYGFLGGALGGLAYCVANGFAGGRFSGFFAHGAIAAGWIALVLAIGAPVVWVRARPPAAAQGPLLAGAVAG